MTAYWHYCSCGRNAAEDKPVALEWKCSHYTPCTADGSGNTWAVVWVTLCPDCKEPLTLRVEYCELHCLKQNERGSLRYMEAGKRGSRGFASDLLMCPYCGKWQRNPGFSLDQGLIGTTMQCASCDSDFEVTAEYKVTWYTKRRE